MKNDIKNSKRGYYKANVQKQKDKLSSLGHYTIHSINIQKILSLREYSVLEVIRHEIEVGSEYISYSLLEVETSFTRAQCIEAVKNLVTIGFITAYLKTKKGTIYKVHVSEISVCARKGCIVNICLAAD
ncbi:hypothetical protein EZS27_031597 [termite gut metagenome]|uniref:Plasmid replication protein RepL domain-containing protein n=1 Tax=termite gut metagenome TaxID=433724 RepID=A0A5J4QA84_9ZZZZ